MTSEEDEKKKKKLVLGSQLLEVCRRAPSDLARIRSLIIEQESSSSSSSSSSNTTTGVLSYRDSEERNALHILCANRPPLASVSYLVQQSKSSTSSSRTTTTTASAAATRDNNNSNVSLLLRQRTSKGMLPLHYACREQASPEVVRFLIQEYPESVRIPTASSSGWYPLHLACARLFASSIQVIQTLLQAWPESAQQEIIARDGRLALHFACANQASLDVIQLLVKYNRQAIPVPDKYEWTPLHIACAYYKSTSKSKSKSTDTDTDTEDIIIINQDKKEDEDEALKVIRYLVQECPEGFLLGEIQGKLGRLPLHVACWEGQSLAVIQFLIQTCRSSVLARDADGLLPLHCACQGGGGIKQQQQQQAYDDDDDSLKVIRYLIYLVPASALELGRTVDEVARYVFQHHGIAAGGIGAGEDRTRAYTAFCEWLIQNVPALAAATTTTTTSRGQASSSSHQLRTNYDNNNNNNGRASLSYPGEMHMIMPPPPSFAPAISTHHRHSLEPALLFNHSSSNNDGMYDNVLGIGRSLSPQPTPGSASAPHSPVQQQPQQSNNNNSTTTMSLLALSPQHVPKHSPEVVLAGQELHEACEAPQSFTDIIRILSEHPTSIEVRTYGKMYPIHTVCLNQAPPDILEFLVSLLPESIRQVDGEGNLPLHLACYSGAPLASIQFLVKEWPESLERTNKQGQVPLERAQQPFLDNPDDTIIAFLEHQMVEYQQRQEQQKSKAAAAAAAAAASPRSHQPPPANSPPIGQSNVSYYSPQKQQQQQQQQQQHRFHPPAFSPMPQSSLTGGQSSNPYYSPQKQQQQQQHQVGGIPKYPPSQQVTVTTSPSAHQASRRFAVSPVAAAAASAAAASSLPPPMGIDELRDKLNALRNNKMKQSIHDEDEEPGPARSTGNTSGGGGVGGRTAGPTPAVPNLPFTTTPLGWSRNQGGPVVVQQQQQQQQQHRNHHPHRPPSPQSSSPSNTRIGRRAHRSQSPGPKNHHHHQVQAGPPSSPSGGRSSRNSSPGSRLRFPSPGRIFGGGRSSRNSSPAPTTASGGRRMIPGFGSDGGARVKRANSDTSELSDWAVMSLRSDASSSEQISLPPRPLEGLVRSRSSGEVRDVTPISSTTPAIKSTAAARPMPIRQASLNRTFEAPVVVEAGAFTQQASRRPGIMIAQEPATRPTNSAMYRAAHGNNNNINPTQAANASRPNATAAAGRGQPFVRYNGGTESQNAGRRSPVPSRPMPTRQASLNRTFEAPVVVEAGTLTERATRPGVMSVNEPAARPDSAMYRAAYGNINTTRSASPSRPTIASGRGQGQPLRQSESNDSLSSHHRSPAPSRPMPTRQASINRTFEAPVVVEAGTLTERATRPGVLSVNEPAARPDSAMYRAAQGNHSGPGRPTTQHPIAAQQQNSSRQFGFDTPAGVDEVRATLAALRESQRSQRLLLDTDDFPENTINNEQQDTVVPHNAASSFYRAAMAESSGQAREQYPGTRRDPQSTGSAPAQLSSFYQAALLGQAASQHRSPPSSFVQSIPESGDLQSQTYPLNGPVLPPHASPFYREAMEANTRRSQAGAENVSSFYRDALYAAGQSDERRSSFQRPDNRLVPPDDVSNRGQQRAVGTAPTTPTSFYRAAMMDAEDRNNH